MYNTQVGTKIRLQQTERTIVLLSLLSTRVNDPYYPCPCLPTLTANVRKEMSVCILWVNNLCVCVRACMCIHGAQELVAPYYYSNYM